MKRISIEDLVAFLRMLPADAGLFSWELHDEGYGCYTLDTTVMFTVPDGRPPPWPHLTIEGS